MNMTQTFKATIMSSVIMLSVKKKEKSTISYSLRLNDIRGSEPRLQETSNIKTRSCQQSQERAAFNLDFRHFFFNMVKTYIIFEPFVDEKTVYS